MKILKFETFQASRVNPAEEKKTKAQEHIDFCIKDIGIDETVAKKLTLGDFSQRDEKTQVWSIKLWLTKKSFQNFQCFVNCFFKRAGFLNEKGDPQKDVIIEKLSQKTGLKNEKLDDLITKCIQVKGADQCETSLKIYECYWTNQSAQIKSAAAH